MTPSQSLQEEAKPWHLVKTKWEGISEPYQQYWYQTVGCMLGALLDSAGYSYESQTSILHHFANLVTPYLGVAPWSKLPRWESFMTDDHTPIELSWDFHTGADQPTIRYSIEPIGADAGTGTNQYNEGTAAAFKQALFKAYPDIETALLDHFEACFNGSWADRNPEGHCSTFFWAFDLNEKTLTNKAYFFPGVVAHATHRSKLIVIIDAITSAPGCGIGMQIPLHIYIDFVYQHPGLEPEIDMLALDLVPLEKARLKIYFRERRTDFGSVKETMSLGGRIQGPEFETGMKRLKRLWDALTCMHNKPDDIPLPYKDHRTAGILYNVEFRMNVETPKVKIYIPVRHYAKNDQQIIKVLEEFLTEQVGQRQALRTAPVSAELYSRCLGNLFDTKALAGGLGVHTYIGCSIQLGGDLRLVSYINPQLGKMNSQVPFASPEMRTNGEKLPN
ncbi:4-O-dimethylallyl-L-tyrosine synthase [Fusarium oxysporum f. sp. cubense]|uniref:4-O-dimethylallyl-L-tyrosine synthase n=1 Tax=Fusarium oxysporum f. sp. cubense TaxID=61366 RepID=A0A559KTK6_FUSOC|nr:4-O-dimethylallyl-L-tyrosine synthase [Fusarium oxysporum f. sp. cubense]